MQLSHRHAAITCGLVLALGAAVPVPAIAADLETLATGAGGVFRLSSSSMPSTMQTC